MKILFICHGNICRSTMAQSIMTHLAPDILSDSAAVSREEIGNDMYPPARRELEKRGVKAVYHRARQVRREDYRHFDLLVCMDNANKKRLQTIIGEDEDDKVRMLMDYTVRPGEVANPWYSGRFDVAFDDIMSGCLGMLERIVRGEKM